MDRFDCVSPLDFRYYDEKLRAILDPVSYTHLRAHET